MPNSYFQFKKFRIEQGQTAMKVTTEACIFAALVVKMKLQPRRILDIGAGTGVLSLMLSQFYECPIDAVEIDRLASEQTAQNFDASPWSNRLTVNNSNVVDFAKRSKYRYDLIICNPPFFSKHLKSGNQQKDQAVHENSMTQAKLIDVTETLISKHGFLAVIYPIYEADRFAELADKCGLNLKEEIMLYDRAGKKPLRKILLLNFRNEAEIFHSKFVIKDEGGQYTSQMTALLTEYYLDF